MLNVISKNASTVGCYDLDILDSDNENLNVIKKLNDNKFKILFLFGFDNFDFKKKDEFIIYIGSHGDKGAEYADIILPSATFTEQDGYYTNLEGKLQKAYKANYPPGEAKEEWIIINELSSIIKGKKLFVDKDNLIKNLLNFLKSNKKNKSNIENNEGIKNEKIFVDSIDYYYTNVIARASKTMSECRNLRLNLKKTGTEG